MWDKTVLKMTKGTAFAIPFARRYDTVRLCHLGLYFFAGGEQRQLTLNNVQFTQSQTYHEIMRQYLLHIFPF